MSEREEYTPDLGSIRSWYAGAVNEYWCDTGMSEEDGEMAFDRAIAAHDRALREQIALDIGARRNEPGQIELADRFGGYHAGQSAGLDLAARIARGKGDAPRPERCPTCGCDLAYTTAVHVVDCGEGAE